MSAKPWAGRRVTEARAHWRPTVEAGNAVCPRCGLPIDPRGRWHVGHVVDRALGGPDTLANTRPEHGRCNEAAGGKLAARLRDAPASRRDRSQLDAAAAQRRDWTK